MITQLGALHCNNIGNIFMIELEKTVFKHFKSDVIKNLFSTSSSNSYYGNIQFTMEIEQNKYSLSLDVL